MRRLLLGLAIVGMVVAPAIAQEKEVQETPELLTLRKEYEGAAKRFATELRESYEAAKKSGKKDSFEFKKQHPNLVYSPRFLALAEKDPEGPSAFGALLATLNTSGGPEGKPGTWAGAIKVLREHYAAKPGLKRVIAMVASFGDDTGDQFVREVIAKNPDRALQVKAYQSLANAREEVAETARILSENTEVRERFENYRGKDEVAKQIARGDVARREAEEFRKVLREKYSDIVADLSVGRPMPELTSEDLDGKKVRLSDLKGKVVVLDVWTTWCGPCREMIPHEREMVERLKNRPFQLVSISADAEKKSLTNFLAREKMPWTHWWSGQTGEAIEALNIQHFPTIFVLDAEGIIRHKEIRGEELEKAVTSLVEEAEAKTKKTAAQ